MEENKLTFDLALKLFAKSTEASKRYALVCAHFAIQHFKDHGDLSLAQRFLDQLELSAQNYLRWRAFAAWLIKYTPAMYDTKTGKLKKDQDRAQKEGDAVWKMDEALATPFWTAIPDREAFTMFGDADVIAAFERMVKRFGNEKLMKPQDEITIARLNRVRHMLAELKEPLKPEELKAVNIKPDANDTADEAIAA